MRPRQSALKRKPCEQASALRRSICICAPARRPNSIKNHITACALMSHATRWPLAIVRDAHTHSITRPQCAVAARLIESQPSGRSQRRPFFFIRFAYVQRTRCVHSDSSSGSLNCLNATRERAHDTARYSNYARTRLASNFKNLRHVRPGRLLCC